jgi:hypothetical protein
MEKDSSNKSQKREAFKMHYYISYLQMKLDENHMILYVIQSFDRSSRQRAYKIIGPYVRFQFK